MSQSNEAVARLWWEGKRETAKSSNGNFWFSGDTIYSYRTPIARKLPECTLVTSRKYSMTTSCKHMPQVFRAGRGTLFFVPDVCPVGERGHQSNLNHLIQEYTDAIATARRARKANLEYLKYGVIMRRRVVGEYAEMFGLTWTPPEEPDAMFELDQIIRHRADGHIGIVVGEDPALGFVTVRALVEGRVETWRTARCEEVKDV